MLIGSDLDEVERPWLTWTLIAVCVGVFAAQWHDPALVERFALVPAVMTGANPHIWPTNIGLPSLFTSAFFHVSPQHLIGNMWFLWLLGKNVEDSFGRVWMLFFIVICELSADIVHIALMPTSIIPSLGASGFIAGISGAYLVLFPNARLLDFDTFYMWWGKFVVQFPAWLWIGLWFAGQLWLLSLSPNGGVAYGAHVGGFVIGAVLSFVLHRCGVIASYEKLDGPRATTRSKPMDVADMAIAAEQRVWLGRITLAIVTVSVAAACILGLMISRNIYGNETRGPASEEPRPGPAQ